MTKTLSATVKINLSRHTLYTFLKLDADERLKKVSASLGGSDAPGPRIIDEVPETKIVFEDVGSMLFQKTCWSAKFTLTSVSDEETEVEIAVNYEVGLLVSLVLYPELKMVEELVCQIFILDAVKTLLALETGSKNR